MAFFGRFHLSRVFIFILVPILLSIWLFAFPYSFDLPRFNETKVIGDINKTQILKYKSPKYSLPIEKASSFTRYFLSDTLKIPLEFNTIDYCFRDKGTYLEYYSIQGSQYDYKNFNWTLNFNNEANYTIFRNGKRCIPLEKTMEFTYYWELNIDTILKGDNTKGLSFHPDTKSYGRKNFKEILRLSITLTLAWMAIFWMLHGVWNIINKSKYRLK